MKDLLGQALLDFQTQNNPENIITETDISEPDVMDVSYLFRTYETMPKIEQKALDMSFGKVLDIGCGAGSHSLYLKEKGLDVTPIDISEKAIQTCVLRGLSNASCVDILKYEGEKFDTLLLLMNGTGIFGQLQNCSAYLTKLKSLLNQGGQILIDSSDLIYMFDEDEDGGKWIPTHKDYYGELTFNLSYKEEKETPFPWLYLDYNTLQNAAHGHGLQCELVTEGEHYDYLARLYV